MAANKRHDAVPGRLRDLGAKHGIASPVWFIDSAEGRKSFNGSQRPGGAQSRKPQEREAGEK